MTTWLRGASLYGSGGNAGDGSAAPGRKSPRWSAERRASRVMGRAAPHSRGSVASRKRDNRNSAPVGAPPTPPLGDGRERTRDEPGRNNAPRERSNTALFDIVNPVTANGSLRAPRLRTLVSRASAARPGTQGDTTDRACSHVRFALGSRVSFRSRKNARYIRPGHEISARFPVRTAAAILVKRTHVAQAQHVGTGGANGSYTG